MPPKIVPPERSPSPLHTSEAPWMIALGLWSYAHRVTENQRVLCLGQRTVAHLVPADDDARRCPTCLQVVGPSAL